MTKEDTSIRMFIISERKMKSMFARTKECQEIKQEQIDIKKKNCFAIKHT